MALGSPVAVASRTMLDPSLRCAAPPAVSGCSIGLHQPQDSEGVPYYLYVPRYVDPTARPLVSVHGILRKVEEHIAAFAPWAEDNGRILLAPLFAEAQYRRYQKVVLDKHQADRALIAALNDVADATGHDTTRIDLFGFSGGAQFAHRFAMLHPERFGRLVVCSAGWYTRPDAYEAYPYGLAPEPRSARRGKRSNGPRFRPNLRAFLDIPVLVLVGERDVERDLTLRKEPMLDRRQGLNRVERAKRWSDSLREVAGQIGATADARLQLLPDCGHSFEECVRNGGLTDVVARWLDRLESGCERSRLPEAEHEPATRR